MKRPIKVMHIIARLNIGGAAVYVIELVEQLNALGYDAQLICGVVGKDEGDMRYIADERHISVTVFPRLGRKISFVGDLVTVFQLWRLIRRERPDIVHTHTAKAGLVGRLAAWLSKVPVIVHTFHGHVFAGYFGSLKTQVFLQLERLCARLSTCIVTLSPGLKNDLATFYRVAPAQKIKVIELGFDLARLLAVQKSDSTFRDEQQIPEQAPLIGIVGRLVPIKNHTLFFEAARRVLDQLPGVYFAVVGDGECRRELEDLVQRLGITDRVRFTGWMTDPTPVYSALDALVLCSKNEGMPVSLIEAMAAGVPVVATAVGGVNDLLQGGKLGVIVPPDDPAALSEAILKTIKEPTIAQNIAHSAREAVRERYDISQSATKTDALYRQLVQKHH